MAADLTTAITERIDKARRKLRSAEHCLAAGDLEDAASRAYYAMFHAAYAALLPFRVAPKGHKGLAAMLSLHRVKPGHIAIDHDRAFVAARDQREYSDYDVAIILGDALARSIVEDARRFVETIEKLLQADR